MTGVQILYGLDCLIPATITINEEEQTRSVNSLNSLDLDILSLILFLLLAKRAQLVEYVRLILLLFPVQTASGGSGPECVGRGHVWHYNNNSSNSAVQCNAVVRRSIMAHGRIGVEPHLTQQRTTHVYW